MIIRARAPLRLGLAGGGTDVPPYCDEYGGAVLNATIDMHAYTILEPLDNGRVEFIAADLQQQYEERADLVDMDEPLMLHRAVYRRMVKQFNNGVFLSCRVTTLCDAPPGSGLGTSSTVVVSMVKAFAEWLNLPLDEYALAQLAFEIEREDAAMLGGRQDQYAAAFGGVNFMEFSAENRVVVNPLRIKNWIRAELESSLILFHTGVSRSSAAIIADQIDHNRTHAEEHVSALHVLKQDAYDMKEALLKGNFREYASYMGCSWQVKKKLAAGVSNSHIEHVYNAAMNAGAVAGKISGAGGGGIITFFVDPRERIDVIRALEKERGRVMLCHLTSQGCGSWRI